MAAIAIDGPAGAGKSTVARAVAAALGFTYVDTGAMYRAVGLATIEASLDPDDETAVGELATSLEIDLRADHVFIGDRDVTGSLRSPDVTRVAAVVARHLPVRSALVDLQRRYAATRDVVMEGRDIASVVLPEAEVKVFLTASLDERAARRARDLEASSDEIENVRTSIQQRDESDSSRAQSPLTRVDDAALVDTTGKKPEEVVAEVVALARERLQ